MSLINRPEDRYHARKQEPNVDKLSRRHKVQRPSGRAILYMVNRVFERSPFQMFLLRHRQRVNLATYTLTFLGCYYIGTLAHYASFRRYVIEDKWVEEYGQDVPHWRKFAFFHWVQRVRAEYIHFYRYRMFYFLEE